MAQLKILWVVNPFQDSGEVRRKGAQFLKSLGPKVPPATPVYVSSPLELQVALEFSVPVKDRYRKVAEERFRKFLAPLKGKFLKPPHVIEEPSPGLAAAAKALADFADSEGADALVLGTRASSGLDRFLMGSYAESLLAYAKTPLVFMNPQARVSNKLRRILFATDLSPASRKAFASLCEFAKAAGASVDLLHVIETPKNWATTYGYLLVGTRAVTPERYVDDLREKGLRKLESFVTLAKSAGVKAVPCVEVGSQKASFLAMKKAEKTGADMIALAAQSSRLRAGLLGSIARDVLRGARRPVWVLHAVR